MSTLDTSTSPLSATDPCPTCGAAMAADQRYCLACGNRRAEARLDYLEVLRDSGSAPPGAPPVAYAAVPGGDGRQQRVNTTVIASIGCLLLAMGVGVLIGNSGNDATTGTPAAAAPQVIKVEGGGTAATASPSAKSSSSSKKTSSSKKKSSGSDVKTAKTAADSKATNPALKDLENTSSSDYSKQSQKLPKQVSTGGKAPPIDKSKPAGGGTPSETIG